MEFFYLDPDGMKSKKIHIVVGSVLFASLMWISINLSEEYQISMEIPLVIMNIPEGKAISRPVPKTLNIKVKGSGWRLTSFFLSGSPTCVLNASELGESPTVIRKTLLLDNIYLTAGVKPVDINIDTLQLAYEKFVERKVKVIPNIEIECAEGYGVVGEMQVDPESVAVGGASSAVRLLQGWRTERRVFSNVRESLNRSVSLEESHSYSVEPVVQSVEVSANVQPFAEKTFSGVAVEAILVPANREIIFIPPKIDIVARGGIDQLAPLSNDDFRAVVNYQALVSDTSSSVQPRVDFPAGIRVLTKNPDRVQYVIRKRL